MMMNKQQLMHSPVRPRREDARDLQSRLYREIGLAAVAAELFGPEPRREAVEPRQDRANMDRGNVKVVRAGDRAA